MLNASQIVTILWPARLFGFHFVFHPSNVTMRINSPAQVSRSNKIHLLCFFHFSRSFWKLFCLVQTFLRKPCFPSRNSIPRNMWSSTQFRIRNYSWLWLCHWTKEVSEWLSVDVFFTVMHFNWIFHLMLHCTYVYSVLRCTAQRANNSIEIVSTHPMWNDSIDLTDDYHFCLVCIIITHSVDLGGHLWCSTITHSIFQREKKNNRKRNFILNHITSL